MKRLFLIIFLLCGFCFGSTVSAEVTEKKAVAVLPLNMGVNSTSYAIYASTQDMFSADLINAIQKYKDTDVVDISASETIIKISGMSRQYENLVKQFKQRYVVNYDLADEIARTLGVNYLVFIHGGFDMEKDFLKSNWKYRCQWIWASQVKPSALLTINITMVDTTNRVIAFQSSVKKDFPFDTFNYPSSTFAENVVPISTIKKFTIPNSVKIAQQIHSAIYPFMNEKYSQKDAFIEKFIPNNGTINTIDNGQTLPDENGVFHENPRKNIYLDWVKDQL